MKLARNIIWNAIGIALPLLVGVAVVPAIVRGLGTERFGFLSIIWVLIGYFSVFDLGLGRTLTKLAADRLAEGREEQIAPLAWTTLITVAVTSTFVSVIVALAAQWVAQIALKHSPALVPEGTLAVLWLAISLPFVLLATVLTGLLEAYQRFGLINAVRVPLGVLILAAPLAVLPFSRDLGVITAALAGIRILNAAVLTALALRIVPALRHHLFVFRRELLRPLLTFGGWLTVSNVVGPLMVYFDRFLIAVVLGSAAIAYYTVPYDVLNRVLVLPTAMQAVLFPTFVMLLGQSSPRVVSVFGRSSETTMLLMAPVLLAVVLLAQQGLQLWVGETFAEKSALTAKILAVGVLANAMARSPFVFIQAANKANWTAILHMIELPLYAIALWLLLRSDGIEGAAYAWSGRVIIDTLVLYLMTARIEPRLTRTAMRDLSWVVGACILAVALDWSLREVSVRIAATLLLGLACGIGLMLYVSGSRPALANRNT